MERYPEIPQKQKGLEFDADSSPFAWEHYIKVYTPKHWKLINEFNLNHIDTYYNLYGRYSEKGNIRYIAGINENSEYSKKRRFWSKFSLSGDCDFNFNCRKIYRFKQILKGKDLDLLDKCEKHHHTLLNFSLMPSTGGMNKFKGNRDTLDGFDRLDTFVYYLNKYLSIPLKDRIRMSDNKTGNFNIFSQSGYNSLPLKNFLDTFDDIYDYCQKIYFIDDREFVKRLVVDGEKPLENPEDVRRYMLLAQDYWDLREKAWENNL
ncbi:hypothetical protein HHO41_12800 [Bacillus sp. DNRA2]|uniref:hypothetical protein n=1 Tax=Bacillus sp. DNRA2 TaxID=2723053 RepID=UPI00145DDF1B|nr:hypothetical protein [Bacillus sp. DNRA2]NMD71179.1 hypothetical protein [Bacillus sp. DNRA2]